MGGGGRGDGERERSGTIGRSCQGLREVGCKRGRGTRERTLGRGQRA